MQKVLIEMNLQLSNVRSDISGVSGINISYARAAYSILPCFPWPRWSHHTATAKPPAPVDFL